MDEKSGQGKGPGSAAVDPAQFRELVEQLERANLAIESLTNRTNTLVHLLDILNRRIDRLEART